MRFVILSAQKTLYLKKRTLKAFIAGQEKVDKRPL